MSTEPYTTNPSDRQRRIMSSQCNPTSPMVKSARSDSNYSSMDSRSQSQASADKKNTTPSQTFSNRGPTYSYEELSNGLTCPTCQGTGKIPRGQETDLVALIPYGDKRLKPRRTWVYILLAVFVCLLLAGILCAFFIPKSVEVVQSNVTTEHVKLNLTDGTGLLSIQTVYNVTNNNFVPVTANDVQLKVTATFSNKKVLSRKFEVDQKISIRSMQQVVQPFNITLTNEIFPIQFCILEQSDNSLYMKFESTFNFTLMKQSDQQLITAFFFVSCRPTKQSDIFTLQAIDEQEFPELSDG